MGERNGTGGRRLRRGLVTVVAALVLVGQPLVWSAPAGAAVACDLVPQLRDVTINQGVGSYPRLARGKETLVKAFLSLPSCAPRGASIARTGGTLTVLNGTTALGTAQAATPAPTATYPTLVPHAVAPALNATGDPTFVVPGSYLQPSSTEAFTASFSFTIRYSAKTSSTAAPVTGSVTFTNRPGTTTRITAPVERKTNALRVLVVPMGDPTKLFSSQFSDAARAATQNGMATVSRVFPVPSGTTGLEGTGGLRYTINPAVLDVSKLLSGGKFCGGTANFDALKGPLAQTLLSWNTANPTKPADRVMGVVDAAISNGGSSGCAEGMAAVGGTQSWVRAIPATSTAPSMTGALMAMELGHTLGLVPKDRSDFYSPHHSPNTQADVTAPDRAYNVSLRSYVNDDRTAMTMAGAWNNGNVLFERDDYLALLCALGGAPGGGCTTSGVVGTAQGVGADPTFVISGTTNGRADGTAVVNSYFAAGAPPHRTRHQRRLPAHPTRTQRHPAHRQRHRRRQRLRAQPRRPRPRHHLPRPLRRRRPLRHRHHPHRAHPRRQHPLHPRPHHPTREQRTTSPTATRRTHDRTSQRQQLRSASHLRRGSAHRSATRRALRRVHLARHDLVPATERQSDVFLRDRTTDTTTGERRHRRRRCERDERPCDGGLRDGRYVAFTSIGPTSCQGTATASRRVRPRRRRRTTTRVSVDASGGDADSGSYGAVAHQRDGRYVAFPSEATDLVAGDTNGYEDAFRRDLLTGTTIRLSTSTAGVQGGSPSSRRRSAPTVAHRPSVLERLEPVPGDGNNAHDVFLKDVSTGTTTRVSEDLPTERRDATAVDGGSVTSPYVAYASSATDSCAYDFNARSRRLRPRHDRAIPQHA
jgi:hypothetical protein